jgi:hypothetical protein
LELSLLRKEVAELSLQLSESLAHPTELSEALEAVQKLSYANAAETMATWTPTSVGYSVLKTPLGSLTFSIKKVTKVKGGTRVVFVLGNTLDCSIDGVTLDVTYGETGTYGAPKEGAALSRKVKLNPLRAGAFNHTAVVLEGITPDKLDYVSVGNFEHTGIRLRP